MTMPSTSSVDEVNNRNNRNNRNIVKKHNDNEVNKPQGACFLLFRILYSGVIDGAEAGTLRIWCREACKFESYQAYATHGEQFKIQNSNLKVESL